MAKKKPAAKKSAAKPAKAKAAVKSKAKAPAKKPAKAAKKPSPPAKKVVAKAPPKKAAKAPAKPAPKAAPAKPQPKAVTAKPAPAGKTAKPAPAPAKPVADKKEETPKKAAPAQAPAKAAPAKNGAAKTEAPAPKAAPVAAPVAVKEPAAKGKKEVKEKEPFVAVMTGYDPLGGPAKTLKRAAKDRYVLEFYLRATPGSLYDLISTPSGFSEWFCDDVNVRGDQFTFQWGPDNQIATCLGRKYGEMIRFHWENDDDAGSFFELRIRIDPMTNETCLVVTDHAWPKDMDESKALWASQIHTLQRVLGA